MKKQYKPLVKIVSIVILTLSISVVVILSLSRPIKNPIMSIKDCVLFLQEKGISVSEGDCVVSDITIPKQFGELYKKYAEDQKKKGYNLSRYKGDEAKLYTFVTWDNDNTNSTAYTVTVVKSKVVAFDVVEMP